MDVRRVLAPVALVVGCLSIIAIWFYPSHADFRPANPDWNGLSEVAGEWRVTRLDSLTLLPAGPRGTALVVIPYRPVSQVDVARINRYLTDGGVVVLLDDFGFANQVLGGLGLRVRFAGPPLLDPLFKYKNRWLPKITDVAILPPGSTVILNHATALSETSGMAVAARSSAYAFLDLNNNGVADPREPRGPFVTAAWTKVGGGVLFVASDPSFLINGMIGLGDNRQFARQILRFAGERPRVLLDEVHLPSETLDQARTMLRAIRAAVASPVGVLAAAFIAVTAPLAILLRRWDGNAGFD